jgi:hypothetical protein
MYGGRGRTSTVFVASVISCLFKPGLTVSVDSSVWTGSSSEPAPFTRTRRDLVHALVSLSCLSFLCNDHIVHPNLEIPLPRFPHGLFVTSVCNLSRAFLEGAPIADLLGNCFALSASLLPLPEFQTAIAGTDASLFVNAFFAQDARLLFSGSEIVNEAVSFIYASLLFQKDLIDALLEKDLANVLITDLLDVAESVLARDGFCYIHSLTLSVLLVLVADPDVAEGLKAPWQAGSVGDRLITVAAKVCEKEPFWPSLVCLLHLIAPHAGVFSAEAAWTLWKVLNGIFEGERVLVPLFLEACASVVQREDNGQNGLLLPIFANQKKLTAAENKAGVAVGILREWAAAAKRKVGKAAAKEKNDEVLLALLAQVELEEDIVEFPRHVHSFRGEIANTWQDWIILLFVRECREEVKKMRDFQLAYDAKLAAKLSQ